MTAKSQQFDNTALCPNCGRADDVQTYAEDEDSPSYDDQAECYHCGWTGTSRETFSHVKNPD